MPRKCWRGWARSRLLHTPLSEGDLRSRLDAALDLLPEGESGVVERLYAPLLAQGRVAAVAGDGE